jgi:hypothetical protein
MSNEGFYPGGNLPSPLTWTRLDSYSGSGPYIPGRCECWLHRQHRVWLLWLIDYLLFNVPLKNFSLMWTGEGLQNLGLCSALRAFELGGIFIVPHLLWHSVFTVSSKDRPVRWPLVTLTGMQRTYTNQDPHEYWLLWGDWDLHDSTGRTKVDSYWRLRNNFLTRPSRRDESWLLTRTQSWLLW